MWWPDHPQDSKVLFLSLVAGLSVAIIILLIELLVYSIPEPYNALVYLFGLIALLILFFSCIRSYSHLRDKLDDLSIKTKKEKVK